MDLYAIFNRIYGLPPLGLGCGLIVCTWLLLRFRRHWGGLRCWRPGIAAALILWFGVVLWSTVLSRTPGSTSEVLPLPFHSLIRALAGGERELLRSCFMNLALFYPAGVLAALLLPESRLRPGYLLALAGGFLLFSLAIELAQYRWELGSTETDDVIHNTLGAFLGAAAAAWGRKRI